MGNQVTREDFEWSNQEEPHAKRRIEILKKYPQIKGLFGVDPTFKWKILALVLIQFMMLFVIRDQSPWVTFLLAYCFGGVINHALMLGKTSNFYFNLDISFKSMFQVSMKSLTAQVLE